jgi:hypothetical protein
MRDVSVTVLGCMALLVLSNCSTEVCACPPVQEGALVSGRVIRDDGTPVPGVRVHAYSAPAAGCVSLETDFGFIETRADGSFRMGLPSSARQDSVCAFVFARPSLRSGLRDSDTALVILDFHPEWPVEAARLELVLRTRT